MQEVGGSIPPSAIMNYRRDYILDEDGHIVDIHVHTSVDDIDCWSLDLAMAPMILAGLKAFRESDRHGIPTAFETMEEWDAVLDKMIFAFEEIISDSLPDPSTPRMMLEEREDRIDEGLRLFGKYYRALWD